MRSESSFMRMCVGSRRMFVRYITMLESRSCMLLCLRVLANSVMVLSLMVMMRGGMVVSGG
jgi:hypothetical protein